MEKCCIDNMDGYLVVEPRMTDVVQPIRLKRHDRVACLERSNPDGDWAGWVRCMSLRTGTEGWVPEGILLTSDDDEACEGGFSSATVTEDYDATEFDLYQNEVVIGKYELNGWLWCHKESDRKVFAWAPLNHLKRIKR